MAIVILVQTMPVMLETMLETMLVTMLVTMLETVLETMLVLLPASLAVGSSWSTVVTHMSAYHQARP